MMAPDYSASSVRIHHQQHCCIHARPLFYVCTQHIQVKYDSDARQDDDATRSKTPEKFAVAQLRVAEIPQLDLGRPFIITMCSPAQHKSSHR